MKSGVPTRLTFARGFSLTELAIVLAIVALLVGGMLMPLVTQQDMLAINDTRKTLANAQDALLGFAAAYGRLPCPATNASNGTAAPLAGGNCTTNEGFLPAVTLGIAPTDNQGYAIDGWGERIRYAVTGSTYNTTAVAPLYSCPANAAVQVFTTTDCMRAVTLPLLAPNLQVCTSGCATNLTTQSPAVIYSTGKNFAIGGTGNDERENPNRNTGAGNLDPTPGRFVSHDPTPVGAANGEFDDIVIWLSPNILYNRMIAAGRLP